MASDALVRQILAFPTHRPNYHINEGYGYKGIAGLSLLNLLETQAQKNKHCLPYKWLL